MLLKNVVFLPSTCVVAVSARVNSIVRFLVQLFTLQKIMKLLLIILIFTFSFATFGQDVASVKTVKEIQSQAKTFRNGKRYAISYDKFEDRTLVSFSGFNMIGFGESVAMAIANSSPNGRTAKASSLALGAGFVFQGDTLKQEPADYFIYFYYSGDDWKFLKSSKLIALVDGERIQFGDGDADRDVKYSGVSELVGFKASKEELQKLSQAKSVEMKIGNFVRVLKPEHLQMFGDILKLGDASQKVEEKKKK